VSTEAAPARAAPATFVRRRPPVAVRRKRFRVGVATHSLLIVAAIVFLLPFVFIVLTSLMTSHQALSPRLWPEPFAWHNYVDVFSKAPMWRYALNTLLYGGLATLGLLVSTTRSRCCAGAGGTRSS
jgi:multiple sugar transport system permease protein